MSGLLRRLTRLDERVLGPAGRRPPVVARSGPLRLSAVALGVALAAGLVLPWPVGDSVLGRLYAVVGSAVALGVVLAVLWRASNAMWLRRLGGAVVLPAIGPVLDLASGPPAGRVAGPAVACLAGLVATAALLVSLRRDGRDGTATPT